MANLTLKRLIVGMVQTNVYLVINDDTKEVIIVDPADEAENIASNIKLLELTPVAIYLTHGHFDHIGAVKELKEKYDIPVVADEAESYLLGNPAVNISQMYGMPVAVVPDVTVNDGDKLDYAGFSCVVMHTPGHTSGSCCYYFPDAGLLICGDTLFQYSYGRTDFETSSYQDMENSIKRLLTELPGETNCAPGHMGYTTIEAEKRFNPLA